MNPNASCCSEMGAHRWAAAGEGREEAPVSCPGREGSGYGHERRARVVSRAA